MKDIVHLKDVVFLQIDKPTPRGHIFPHKVADEILLALSRRADHGCLMGTLSDAINTDVHNSNLLCVDIAKVSHQVKNIRKVNDTLICDIHVLDTMYGNTLNALYNLNRIKFTILHLYTPEPEKHNVIKNSSVIQIVAAIIE